MGEREQSTFACRQMCQMPLTVAFTVEKHLRLRSYIFNDQPIVRHKPSCVTQHRLVNGTGNQNRNPKHADHAQFFGGSNEHVANFSIPATTLHQGLKQTTGVGNCSAQRTHAQKIHIFSSMVAFLKLEKMRQQTGQSWYEQKAEITRSATRAYLVGKA